MPKNLLMSQCLCEYFTFRPSQSFNQVTCGNCFAMSPPTKTASRYTQRFCTVIQFSMISEELDRLCTHVWMFFLNGALYLQNKFQQFLFSAIC